MSDVAQVPRIHRLSTTLANQIAAGEVIERPASVVKELLENSLDAAASELEIRIEKAGNRLIRVRDNGQGIHVDDLVLALDRHATSKLHTSSDLGHIVSLGFRGEALPSIASVSRLSITSRALGAETAWSLVCDVPGRTPVPVPAAHPTGTSVEVSDLFFNTPARRKFLKSEKTELHHIQLLIRRLALSRYNVGFHCINNGRPLFHFRATGDRPEQRCIDVCGMSFYRQAVAIDYERKGMHLWGWVGSADNARSQNDQQYFFLNGRSVRDKQVNHAVRMAYQDKIHADRYPVYVLYLEIDPASVDVNVHPTKHEVRFREPRDVHDFIYNSLHKACTSTSPGYAEPGDSLMIDRGHAHTKNGEYANGAGYPVRDIERTAAYQSTRSHQLGHQTTSTVTPKSLILCQGRFLIMEVDGDPVLIDVHATVEATTLERLRLAIADDGSLRTRPLLVPLTLHVSEMDAGLADECKADLLQYGVCLDRLAPDTLMVRELPAMLPFADAVSLVRDVINSVRENSSGVNPGELLKMMAGHAGDGAARSLDSKSINQLWNDIQWLEQVSDRSWLHQLYTILDPSSLITLLRSA